MSREHAARNYRVVEVDDGRGDPWFCIHEVYYHPDGSVKYFSAYGSDAFGDTPDELEADLQAMQDALAKPVLKLSYLKSSFPDGRPPTDGEGLAIIYDVANIPDIEDEAEAAAYWDTHTLSEELLERAAHRDTAPARTRADEDAAATPERQPLRDLLNTLLDLGATLDDWDYLANPLRAAQADLAKALRSPVFDSVRHEDEFRDPGADLE